MKHLPILLALAVLLGGCIAGPYGPGGYDNGYGHGDGGGHDHDHDHDHGRGGEGDHGGGGYGGGGMERGGPGGSDH